VTFASYPSLVGRVVLITGGASGIGAEMVRQFAHNGARVAFLDIQDEAAQTLVADLGAIPPRAQIPSLRCHRHPCPARHH
jgi:NAD(P)-dependent dehydrogenase (short-subunit alcohol dehydrogenase family)